MHSIDSSKTRLWFSWHVVMYNLSTWPYHCIKIVILVKNQTPLRWKQTLKPKVTS